MIVALQTIVFFRESLLNTLDRFLRPYYKRFSLVFSRSNIASDDDESDEQVFSVYDDERGVVFYPPVYSQRYAAVSDCLIDERWCGKLEKVVDLGYHDMSFVKYLKEIPGVKCILGVDIESIPFHCSSDMYGCDEYALKREIPLEVTLFQGNAADPDYRLIGCDAVIAIEMIEHMLPHDLDRLIHTIFGFIKPWIVIFTTPNADFNVLFKSLGTNGLRRIDHFFEWTRQQFNDWCSNVVARYPQYLVSCRGIGPGPPDTHHLGCCSQMALFISKDYNKQQDLNLNSLTLVEKVPSPNHLCYITSSSDIVESYEENTTPNTIQSYTELLFSERQSEMTIAITSPSFSLDCIEYQDIMSQCNFDSEVSRNFLMFDDEQMCFTIIMPRKKVYNKVYEIEDLTSRLNCTTLQVNRFSKTTQNLMAKNKIDSLVHMREVVDEIRHLTKMLNFNRDYITQDNTHCIWANTNWGDNAPYWNQYYKIVKEFKYPFETKSEECRILDLISDEINKLIDMEYNDEFCVDDNRLEIPLPHLMDVVKHITDNVDKVKDLLEWNGYEIVNDVVIYSRLAIDNTSVISREDVWQNNEALSDLDSTELHSTSLSDGSTIVPDYRGHCLRHALDCKLRKLRSMLTADEDITTELDRIVCRLMKLALHTCRDRHIPPPTKWLQCKLLDLLTLTEKSIARRKRCFIETYPLNAINYDIGNTFEENAPLDIIKKDNNTANKIVNKYRFMIQPTDTDGDKNSEDSQRSEYLYPNMELSDNLSVTNTDILKECEYVNRLSPGLIDPELILNEDEYKSKLRDQAEIKLNRVRNWIDEDSIEVVPYPNHRIPYDNSSGDTDPSAGLDTLIKYSKTHKGLNSVSTYTIHDLKIDETDKKKLIRDKRTLNYGEYINKKIKCNKKKLTKKVTRKKSSCSGSFRNNKKGNSSSKRGRKYPLTPSKPIPESLINLCHPQLSDVKYYDNSHATVIDDNCLKVANDFEITNISAIEESYFIDIVTEGMRETIALRRTIGTDAISKLMHCDCETVSQCIEREEQNDLSNEHVTSTENVESQTIFLNDINEPSTSKGTRRTSMDVQCGSDDAAQNYLTLSATTSFIKIPNLIESSDKLGSFFHGDVKVAHVEFGTSTGSEYMHKTIIPNSKSIGIRILDSEQLLLKQDVNNAIIAQEIKNIKTTLPILQDLADETKLSKAVSINLKSEDSVSDTFGNMGSSMKTALNYAESNNLNDVQLNFCREVPVLHKLSTTIHVKPMLCCGGVHIHSYTDQIVSEDVVYQGEWQRYRAKPVIKKGSLNSFVLKKVIHKPLLTNDYVTNNRKPMIAFSKIINDNIQLRNPKLYDPKPTSKTLKIEKRLDTNKRSKVGTDINIIKNRSKHKVGAPISKSNNRLTKPTVISSYSVKKDTQLHQQPLIKNYIPSYLQRKEKNTSGSNATNAKENLMTVAYGSKVNNKKTPTDISVLKKTEIKDITASKLLKFQPNEKERLNYFVFRNEISTKNSASSEESANTEDKIPTKNSACNRSQSPESLNSSTCSSPNSIATIRFVSKNPKSAFYRKNTAPSHISNINDSCFQNPAPSRLKKKFTKRTNSSKSTKKPGLKGFDNKENCSDKCNSNCMQNKKIAQHTFKGSKTNVFIAQVNTNRKAIQPTATSYFKYKEQRSDFNLTLANSVDTRYNTGSPSVSNMELLKSESILFNDNRGLLIEPQIHKSNNKLILSKNDFESKLNCSVETDVSIIQSEDIQNEMKQLLEETLKTLVISEQNSITIKSEEIPTNIYGNQNPLTDNFDNSRSNNNELNSSFDIAAENDLNNSFNITLGSASILSITDTNITMTDLDLLSFKSITSESKLSESYFDGCDYNILTPKSNSVREIVKGKDEPLSQIPAGIHAIEAFSGFSINGETFVADQPDHINLVDSETGSLAYEIARQATSEELFVSGRSSDSYQSCAIDEDSVVPNWLFRIIRQQQSVAEELESLNPVPPIPLEGPMVLVGPVFDVNGNTPDPELGAGTGAGDGRGMHSDHSQDSSGRGSSLSSSDTSSGQQSEAIIIDASTFLRQFEAVGERSSLEVPTIYNEETRPPSHGIHVVGVSEQVAASSRSSRGDEPSLQLFLAASDVDADVSSFNTDATDSSDN